jgi:hypothetical protein
MEIKSHSIVAAHASPEGLFSRRFASGYDLTDKKDLSAQVNVGTSRACS